MNSLRDVNVDVIPQYAEFLSRNGIKGVFGKSFTFYIYQIVREPNYLIVEFT